MYMLISSVTAHTWLHVFSICNVNLVSRITKFMHVNLTFCCWCDNVKCHNVPFCYCSPTAQFFKESNCIIFVWISIGFVLLCLNDTFMSCYLIEFYVLFVGLLNSEDDKPPRLWRILTLLNSFVFSTIPFLFFARYQVFFSTVIYFNINLLQ